jgi:putative ABC transport system substrate-binding protein
MRRRAFISLLAAFLACSPAPTRARATIRRIGWLGFLSSSPWEAVFRKRLQELGYVAGRDYEITARYTEGDQTLLPALAIELTGLNPEVILAVNSAAAVATRTATTRIPIVVAGTIDPVSLGLAASHARPEGNVTGIIAGFDSIIGKQLELGFELMPGTKILGMLVNVGNPTTPFYREAARGAAKAKGAEIAFVEIHNPAEIDTAFQALARMEIRLVIVPPAPMFVNERRRIAELGIIAKLPIVCAFREHAEDGGLLSYGADLRANFQRAADYVDRILQGAKPADLPIEQPTKFELIINLRTAKALGLTIPPTLLARADEVIE